MKTAIGVMARAPAAGEIASRLLDAHSADWVAGLYAAMLRDTLDGLQSVAAERYVVFGAPLPTLLKGKLSPREEDWTAAREILSRHVPSPWEIVPQRGEDIGARIYDALQNLAAGGTRAVLVASDAPSFPTEPLAEALAGDDDVILGPCTDGTYYAVATKTPERRLFSDIPWKTPAQLETTRVRIRELGLAVRELPPWYRVDDPSDVIELLEELRRHPERAPRTAQFLVTHA